MGPIFVTSQSSNSKKITIFSERHCILGLICVKIDSIKCVKIIVVMLVLTYAHYFPEKGKKKNVISNMSDYMGLTGILIFSSLTEIRCTQKYSRLRCSLHVKSW